MFKSEMATRVKEIIVSTLNIAEADVTLQAHIVRDLGANTHKMSQLVTNFEKEFGITFTSEQATSFTSVGDLLPIIEANLCEK